MSPLAHPCALKRFFWRLPFISRLKTQTSSVTKQINKILPENLKLSVIYSIHKTSHIFPNYSFAGIPVPAPYPRIRVRILRVRVGTSTAYQGYGWGMGINFQDRNHILS